MEEEKKQKMHEKITTSCKSIIIDGEIFEVMCDDLRKITKNEICKKLDVIVCDLPFVTLTLRFNHEIKLLLENYFEEIIILVENIKIV